MTGDPLPVVVLADMITAASDDLGYPMRQPVADRLAAHVVEPIAIAGWCLVRDGDG